jgi:manganese/iron transport system substrate-binding protein
MILDKRLAPLCACIAAAVSLAGCTGSSSSDAPKAAHGKLVVACTISTLCSLVSSVGGVDVEVSGLVPVGASPETFEPTPSDIVTLSHAGLLFENGLGLEAWLGKILTSAGAQDLKRVVLSDSVPAADRASGNPHLWMDPAYAADYVRSIGSALIATDPSHAPAYRANERSELARLAALDRWTRAQIATIPPEHRTMICFHDAWFYFDRRYGIKNLGAIEPAPGREPSPGYFARLITLARDNHVRAVFGEPQYSPKLAAALQSGAGIKMFADLYDDTLGAGPDLSTYEGMMRYDVSVIVTALRP